MKVVEGNFKKPEEGPKTLEAFLREQDLLGLEVEGFVGLAESKGRLITMCYPDMSTIEILGVMDTQAFMLKMAMVSGDV